MKVSKSRKFCDDALFRNLSTEIARSLKLTGSAEEVIQADFDLWRKKRRSLRSGSKVRRIIKRSDLGHLADVRDER